MRKLRHRKMKPQSWLVVEPGSQMWYVEPHTILVSCEEGVAWTFMPLGFTLCYVLDTHVLYVLCFSSGYSYWLFNVFILCFPVIRWAGSNRRVNRGGEQGRSCDIESIHSCTRMHTHTLTHAHTDTHTHSQADPLIYFILTHIPHVLSQAPFLPGYT